jgi:osmotically inducible protein OsmC
MTKLENVIHTGKAHTTGGRNGGASRTDDGRLDVKLSVPGKPGTGTNPEQLFAVGWSACFLSAIKIAASKARVTLPTDLSIDVEVDLGLGPANNIQRIAARLNLNMPGVDRQVAESLAEAAHHLCPYSNATRGNIEVTLNVVTGATAQPMEAAQHV